MTCPASLGSPALSALVSGRDRAAARAQLWTLGGLEDLRGFPRGAAAGFLSPPRWWALPCLSSVGPAATLASWQEGEWALAQGHGTAPNDRLPGQARRRPWGPETQLVRATGVGHSGHETLLSPWW